MSVCRCGFKRALFLAQNRDVKESCKGMPCIWGLKGWRQQGEPGFLSRNSRDSCKTYDRPLAEHELTWFGDMGWGGEVIFSLSWELSSVNSRNNPITTRSVLFMGKMA